MDFNEFYALAEKFGGIDYPNAIYRNAPSRPYGKRNVAAKFKKEWLAWERWVDTNKINAIYHESWVIGGVTGGTCWGGHPDTPVLGEQEPAFESLDELLLEVAPNFSFLLYRKMENSLIKRGQHGSHEYYGNNTEYADKSINLKELFDFLMEYNVIP